MLFKGLGGVGFKDIDMSETTSDWSFNAGKLALNFANTADWHSSDAPEELLLSYNHMTRWATHAGLLTDSAARKLRSAAAREPQAAKAALDRSISLRELCFRIFSAIAREQDPSVQDLAQLNQALAETSENARVVHMGDGFQWKWDGDRGTLDWMLGPIARAAADLLTSGELHRIGLCADDRGCGYLFYDTSRNHSRKWCSMDACGNRAKAKRHYQRQSGSLSAQGERL